jgi:hypothetical protein
MRKKLKKKIGWKLWLIRKLLPKGSHLHRDPVRKPKGEGESSGIDVSYPWPNKPIEPVEV